MSNPEQEYLKQKDNLFKKHLSEYKKRVLECLNEGINCNYFYNETSNLYQKKLQNFKNDNKEYLFLRDIFDKIKRRYDINAFNKTANHKEFEIKLLKNNITIEEFILIYSLHESLEKIIYTHTINSDILNLFSRIYYNDNLKYKVEKLNIPIFLDKDMDKIRETKNKLTDILHPQQQKQERYPLWLFNVKFSVREVATLIIFMRNHYNINSNSKSQLLEIAYLIFGDINLELKLNIPTNNSALYDFINGKRLFVDENYNYENAKSKILKALSYIGTTKFKRFKLYINKHDLKDFKELINKK